MILVTGAAGALGQAVVRRCAASGVEVIAADYLADIPAAGQRLSFGGLNLAEADDARSLIEKLAAHGIRLTGLVNVVGGFLWQTVGEGGWSFWERMYRINMQTTFEVTRHCLPLLRETRGSIVNVGAAASLRATSGMAAYTASKSAVARFTEALAAEESTHGVRVNAVLPSVLDTAANRRDMPDADFSRWVTVDEVAAAIGFLLSDAASGISGTLLPVTRGA
jgi:NAD(P)-dependent dehydrogenase (short-subunit alcohol dehydrogenase family)